VFAASVALTLAVAVSVVSADEIYSARTSITLPGGQLIKSTDINFVDPVIGVYILADKQNKAVDVFDTTTNTLLAQLAPAGGMVGGPNGVVTVNHREVWAGDGSSTVAGVLRVLDLFSQKQTHAINTGGSKRVDEMCFDPRDQLLLVANDEETPFPFVSIVSTENYSILKQITMNGTVAPGGTVKSPAATNGIEQCQWDQRTGKFYVNIPEVNGPGNDTQPGAVVTISPTTLQIENVYSIPIIHCAGPQGMAVGPDHQILLGCNDPNGTVPNTVIIDDRNASIIADVPNEDGADEVYFNEGD
jgi:hypothetical protein